MYRAHFNSHAHEGRDVSGINATATEKHFNSHAHEGRDGTSNDYVYCAWHFNSHAHEGRDDSYSFLYPLQQLISTHTPTRGVT